MSKTPTNGTETRTASMPRLWRWLKQNKQRIKQFYPQFRNWHFWMIQGLVILIASVHGIIETTDMFQEWRVPFVMPTGLFLVPTVYAALTFGLSGALITALWAGILSIHNIVLWHDGIERLGEVFQLTIVMVVAFFVGRQVDRVKGAQRQAEFAATELKASRMRYRSLFESSPVAILVLDAKGVILEANPAATILFNVDKTALEGHSVTALLGTEDAQKVLASPFKYGQQPDLVMVKLNNGSELYLESTTNEISDGQGGLFTEVLFRDVTQEHGRQTGLRAYTAYVMRAQEEERQRIALELHDQTIQSLVLLCRRLDSVQDEKEFLPTPARNNVREAKATAEEIVKGLRDFTKTLRPSVLDDLGLVTSIRRLLADFAERTGVSGKFKVAGEERRLPSDIELGIFRIAQEALRNVEHHAAATRVASTVTFTEREARLEVIDNGTGFIVTSASGDLTASGHLGLISMQERAKLLGGTLTIRSSPGKGTSVIVSIPTANDLLEV